MSGAASALRSLSLALSSFITISLCVSRPSCLFDPISDMATLSNSLTLGCPTGRQAQRSHVGRRRRGLIHSHEQSISL